MARSALRLFRVPDRPPRRYSSICSAYREGRTGVSRALPVDTGQRLLLTNPRLVLKPYLQRLSLRPVWQDFRNPTGKVFFKSSLGLRVGLGVFRAH